MPRSFVKKTRAALPGNAPAAQKKLLDELSASIHDDDLQHFNENIFADMVESHWDLSKTRDDGRSRVAIYCPITQGQSVRKTVIDVVTDDMAFLVDSIAAEINKKTFLIDLLIHPIFYAKYEKGKLVDISSKKKEGYLRRSHIHIHIKETLTDEALEALIKGLQNALDDVYIANRDWPAMLKELKDARDELSHAKIPATIGEVGQYAAFLDYLYNNNFTLLGFREYEFSEDAKGNVISKTLKNRSLGVLSDDARPVFMSDNTMLPPKLQQIRRNQPPVFVSKTNALSTVHRSVPMDSVAVKTYDSKGKVKGEKLFLGLFTSVTYSRSVSDVPYLREKVEAVMSMSDFLPGSHDRKALRHILEKYPRDELFQTDEKQLFESALEILRLQERQRIALFVRRDVFGRYISCLVYVPRERFGTALRKRMTAILEEELEGVCTNFYTSMDDSLFARAMFIIDVSQKNPPKYNVDKIEKRLQEAGQTVQERLAAALTESLEDEQEITRLTLKYGEAFPVGYSSRYRSKQAVFDIRKIEECLNSEALALDLYKPESLDDRSLRLKVYNPAHPLTLSDVMPILEHMGLRAISELPFEIKPRNANKSVWIHDFLLQLPESSAGQSIVLADVKENFERAFTRVWYNQMDSDDLNTLILLAGMNWHEVTILRAYERYLRQTTFPFSQNYIHAALTLHPDLSRLLVDLFKARHNPAHKTKGEALAEACLDKIESALEKVESLDHDRIIRSLTGLVKATLRTNYYQRQDSGEAKTYLSLKFDSKQIPELPEPKPFREIFVYSPRVEAVHLRADKVARGGLRWSDRHEDYRTEVLGLIKAQQVKNAVIVPMGAKGGFVVKSKIKDRKAYIAEGIECYRIFIRGLLDITDNLKNGKIVHPHNVVRHDEDDPYLVVAADKGTATFSDIANALSLEYGFWLGDAFASGGSAGYDHKKMGITAKGAWECVKRHFRQLNHDIQTKPFDVIGVGDMGGDVFGNGMLLSEHIRLVGAFNHMHIFCDPNPDTAASFKERERLFKNVMGWDQYDAKKLSPGGRIFLRSEKFLTLTPEIRKRFDLEKDKVTPAELIQAILKARTDLVYFGGIGVYVKASSETHAQAGDKTNEALRVDATQLRAKVIGEGANMAVTQRARIEYAEKGGKINTDFLDNSAGVDTSDHEVNIKILMTDIMSQKAHNMDLRARNTLLSKMTDEVAALVLRDNYQQSQAISLGELQARETLKIQEELIQDLERDKGLNRELEFLPSAATIETRLRLGKGMTRPELCVLLAYSKISLTQDLLATELPDLPEMRYWLTGYFPAPLQKKYGREIQRHKLHREIIAMSMANSVINRMGTTFVKTLSKKTGATPGDITKAYLIVREIYQLKNLWVSVEALDNKVPAEVQLKAMREISRMAEHAATWFLTRMGHTLDIARETKNYGPAIANLSKNLKNLVSSDLAEHIQQHTQIYERDGLPTALAQSIASMSVLGVACDIIRIAMEQKSDLNRTAQIYFEVGEHFHLDWLRQQARFMNTEGHWHTEAVSGLIDKLYVSQGGLTVRILKDMGKKPEAAEEWFAANAARIEQIDRIFAQIRHAGTLEMPMLIIAEQRLHSLYGG